MSRTNIPRPPYVAILAALMSPALLATVALATTYTTPRQLNVSDAYQLNPDGATGDEDTTCPKTDANDGAAGDNPYFQRHNVARAHLGGCSGRYWYTSNYAELCTDPTPVNTCGAGPCMDEPDPAGEQWVDYAPPFGTGDSQLTPGRYRINAEYRNTTSRASYPALYIVNHVDNDGQPDQATIAKSQLDGTSGSCIAFDLGVFNMDAGSYVRVQDTGSDSITFNRLIFTLEGPLGGVPYVNAGPDQTVILPAAVGLGGIATDDGLPSPLTTTWSKVSGPGTVNFADAGALATTATFTESGPYVLRLTAYDGLNTVTDDLAVTALPPGGRYTYSTQYEFNDPTNPDPSTLTGVIDTSATDADGNGLLTKVGTGYGNAGGGFTGQTLHYVDSSTSGNFGWYWQNNGLSITFTVDMRVKVNDGVCGTSNRRSMGFTAGNSMNLGLRLHRTNDASGGCTPVSGTCSTGSVRFAAASGGTGSEGCINFQDDGFHRLRVSVNAATNTFHVFDLDNNLDLTGAIPGSAGATVQSWAVEIHNKGGFHIGSLSGGNTTRTDYELDYVRVLLGAAVEDASTQILGVGQCNDPFADMDGDGDVDMDDFGRFQACWTGSDATISDPSCQCLDRTGDNRVGEADLNAFKACASGPDLPADKGCDGL